MDVDFASGDRRRNSIRNIVDNDDDESDGPFDTVSVANSNRQPATCTTETSKPNETNISKVMEPAGIDKNQQRQNVRDEELLELDFAPLLLMLPLLLL